ncbi:hypothetical protein ACFW04_014704 [Cataglyphis niger]
MKYILQEYTNMILTYELAGENARGAAEIYAERFPKRARQPNGRTILRVVRQLRETRCLIHNVGPASIPAHLRVQNEEKIFETFDKNPGSSMRRMAHIKFFANHDTWDNRKLNGKCEL